jgi:hypothetical protein
LAKKVENLLDVIVDDTSLVKEFNTREEVTEPFASFQLVNFHRNEFGIVVPKQAHQE